MFYVGIVEDNEDPKKLGRLKIRIFGIHTENKENKEKSQFLFTDDLPWAYPAFPASNSCIDGISDFSTIVPGTRVMVFFIDKNQQIPYYFAVLPFILDELPDFDKGFSDPNEEHPKEEYRDESSISRLARNEKTDEDDCPVKIKSDNKKEWTVDGTEVKEPDANDTFAAEYPHNRVIEAPGGMVIELDSTEGAERVHIFHPSGSYIEILQDGVKVNRSEGNSFNINIADKNVYVGGNLTLKVDEAAKIEIDGETKLVLNDKCEIESKAELIIKSTDKITIESSTELIAKATTSCEIEAGGAKIVMSGGIINLN